MKAPMTLASLIAALLFANVAWGQAVVPDLGPVLTADQPIELFENTTDAKPVPRSAGKQGWSVMRTIRLKTEPLAKLAIGKRVLLAAETSVEQTWTVEALGWPAPHVQIIRCALDGDPTGYAVLVTVDDTTAMSLRIGSQHLAYRLHALGNGLYDVWKLDATQREPELCFQGVPVAPVSAPRGLEPGDDDWVPDDDDPTPRDGGGCSSIPIIDTMVMYTPAARIEMGGHSAIRAEAALAVELANVAYAYSLNTVRARLVYCSEIQYVEAITATGGADMDTDLSRLRGTDDGFMDQVHAMRDNLNADLVVVYQNTGSGLGYCPDGTPPYNAGFSVVAWWRAAGTYTHAHETGHNLGCGHSREEGDGPCGPSYGLGWRYFGNDGHGYCTTMAYENETYDRILRYSNPNVTYQGMPTGNPIGDPFEAYNARVINDNDNTVSNLELTRFDIYLNFAWNGVQVGTASLPYNTVTQGVAQIDVPEIGAAELPNLYMTSGVTPWTGVINKAMVMQGCGGTVRIGG